MQQSDISGKYVFTQPKPSSLWKFWIGPELAKEAANFYVYNDEGQRLHVHKLYIVGSMIYANFHREYKGTLIVMTEEFINKTLLLDEIESLEKALNKPLGQ